MDGAHFEALATALGRANSRREALKILAGAIVGAAFVIEKGGNSVVEAGKTPPATSTSGYLCNQPYALCTSAPCVPSDDDPNMVICRCFVENGYSFGYTACSDRMPNGTALISTFSLQNVTSQTRAMSCSVGGAGGYWANCVDSPCQADPADPTQALCRCPVVQSQQYFTLGGNCDQSTCTSVIWSGASANTPTTNQYIAAMQQLNQPVANLQNCPPA
jgi:hypothetical protein